MNESLWMYFFLLMGILGIVLINIFGGVMVDNEQNYFLLKEVTEAAMYDAIDVKALRDGVGWDGVESDQAQYSDYMHCESGVPGTIRIIRERFVESFVRRFAETANLDRKYKIVIHDIDECPPKVSISLAATQRMSYVEFFNVSYDSDDARPDVVNSLTGILETVYPKEPIKK